jgi:hypothetical protein
MHYGDLAESLAGEEGCVTEAAFRQRVSRGVRVLEAAIRERRWMQADVHPVPEAQAC